MMRGRTKDGTLAMAVGPDRILVLPPGGVTPERRPLEWTYDNAPGGPAPTLEAALRAALETSRRELAPFDSLVVALEPGSSEMRRLTLPPLRAKDLRHHLAQRGSRYLPMQHDEWLAAPAAPDRVGGGRWIAFAHRPTVEAIHRVADELDVEVRCVAPAVAGWRALFDDRPPVAAGQSVAALAVHHTTAEATPTLHVLWRTERSPVSYRRFPATPLGARALVAALPRSMPIALLASTRHAASARALLDDAGVESTSIDRSACDDPSGAAAWQLALDPQPWIVPPALAAHRTARARRRMAACIAASIAILIAAGVIRLWGFERELAALRAERAGSGQVVASALDLEERVTRLELSFADLDRLAATSPRWSVTLTELGAALPQSSYITGLRAAGDSLHVDAVAADAAETFRALAGAGALRHLRPVSAVRRETLEGEDMIERFTLAGRLATTRSGGSAP